MSKSTHNIYGTYLDVKANPSSSTAQPSPPNSQHNQRRNRSQDQLQVLKRPNISSFYLAQEKDTKPVMINSPYFQVSMNRTRFKQPVVVRNQSKLQTDVFFKVGVVFRFESRFFFKLCLILNYVESLNHVEFLNHVESFNYVEFLN